ncbi:hypothetical protein L484_012761 [Morus notabilis]|uniref:Uncharacterized protein n=1 Tax=Morus notabilis TaxID=981085 RepID=W9RVU1_9ROSA|nr:hypothetical protein L484_012761 [Morus notabilis]
MAAIITIIISIRRGFRMIGSDTLPQGSRRVWLLRLQSSPRHRRQLHEDDAHSHFFRLESSPRLRRWLHEDGAHSRLLRLCNVISKSKWRKGTRRERRKED